VTRPDGDTGRLRRVLRLRSSWRKDNPAQKAVPADADAAQRRSDALDSNDRIRDEAPDDLETRRRADELEREIRRTRGA
jgi:hypothetical protein